MPGLPPARASSRPPGCRPVREARSGGSRIRHLKRRAGVDLSKWPHLVPGRQRRGGADEERDRRRPRPGRSRMGLVEDRETVVWTTDGGIVWSRVSRRGGADEERDRRRLRCVGSGVGQPGVGGVGGGAGRLTGGSYTRATALVDARKPTRRTGDSWPNRSYHRPIITPISGDLPAQYGTSERPAPALRCAGSVGAYLRRSRRIVSMLPAW